MTDSISWNGHWSFNMPAHYLHGDGGTKRVEAPTEEGARDAIREAASRELFNNTRMKQRIEVTGLIQIQK